MGDSGRVWGLPGWVSSRGSDGEYSGVVLVVGMVWVLGGCFVRGAWEGERDGLEGCFRVYLT